MNAAQLHLIFTHLPIVGLGFVILINLISLFYYKSQDFYKLTLWLYVVLGVFALLAYITGDGAEEIMKTYPGITEDIIEPHENLALIFFICLMITSAVAIAGLYYTKTKENLLKRFTIYLLIAGIFLSLVAIGTGTTGGNIRHTEIKQECYKKM
jgi:uncharacterized membrane protein